MQKEKHAQYQEVLFVDSTSGKKFVCGTTVKSEQKEKFQGKEYPVIVVPISSASHPFFVGGKQFVDAEGRVDRFRNKYQNINKRQPKEEEKPVEKKPSKKKA